MKQDMVGLQWHQLYHTQIICISLQTGNHASTSSLNFLQAGCSFRHSANSVKALKATEANRRSTAVRLYRFDVERWWLVAVWSSLEWVAVTPMWRSCCVTLKAPSFYMSRSPSSRTSSSDENLSHISRFLQRCFSFTALTLCVEQLNCSQLIQLY